MLLNIVKMVEDHDDFLEFHIWVNEVSPLVTTRYLTVAEKIFDFYYEGQICKMV